MLRAAEACLASREQGQEMVLAIDGIATKAVYGEVVAARLADGAGARWRSGGEFIGFLERSTRR